MKFGIVRYFNVKDGYGLIAPDGEARDVIVQQAEVDRARLGQLAPQQRVGFEIAERGANAEAVNLWATFGDR